MKDSSNTNDFFDGACDNLHFDPDIILPFLENDILKIQFQYVFLNPDDVNLTITQPVRVDYSFIIQKGKSPITLGDFAYHFSHFWVCQGLRLVQSKYVEWKNITILNQTAKHRLKYNHYTFDYSNTTNAYHFFNTLIGINGQIDDLKVKINQPHLFQFKKNGTNNVIASTPLFFVVALFLIYDSENYYTDINTEKALFQFLRQTLKQNFTKPFSICGNNSNYFTLQFINQTYSKTATFTSTFTNLSTDLTKFKLTPLQLIFLFSNNLN